LAETRSKKELNKNRTKKNQPIKTWSMPVPANECNSSIVPCALCGGLKFKTALNCEGFFFVRCKNCSLVQRNPQPDKDEITARYKNIYGDDYLSYEIKNEASFLALQQLALKDAKFDKLEKKLLSASPTLSNSVSSEVLTSPALSNSVSSVVITSPALSNSVSSVVLTSPTLSNSVSSVVITSPSVLDIGCATGTLLETLQKKGFNTIGVEISPSAEYARKNRSLDVRSLPLEENKFADNSFDVILASHLIEHLNDPHYFLTEVYRILKNNGQLFITTPNIASFQANLFGGQWRSAIFDHLYLFSRRTLLDLLKKTGFKIISCHTWGGLAAGTAPTPVKKCADFLAKRFNCGDVMIVCAAKAV